MLGGKVAYTKERINISNILKKGKDLDDEVGRKYLTSWTI